MMYLCEPAMSNRSEQYAELILPLAVAGTFTYSIPEHLSNKIKVGFRVIVAFGKGKKQYTAVVAGLKKNSGGLEEVKPIIDCLDDEVLIGRHSLDFWNWMSDYYMCHIGEVMSAALPALLNLSSETLIHLSKTPDIQSDKLSDESRMILATLEREKELQLSKLSKSLAEHFSMKRLKELVDLGYIYTREEVHEKYSEKQLEWLSVGDQLSGKHEFEEIVLNLKRSPKQLQSLMRFIEMTGWDGENAEVEFLKKNVFLKESTVTAASVKSLLVKGLLKSTNMTVSRLDHHDDDGILPLLPLSNEQVLAKNEIVKSYEQKDVVLLQGVTSSGKTEIYAHLIEEVIRRGEQVLYLLPEIALTSQLIRRLKKYFGLKIGLYHSRMSQKERTEVWKRTAGSRADSFDIVLGARSSVFLPFKKLGLIVVDEEHDRSYKQQDPAPRYLARDAAIVLGGMHKAKVLLGSATPSLDSYYNFQEKKFGGVALEKRFGGHLMPEMKVVDLIQARRKRQMRGAFSNELIEEMSKTLDRGEQVILFQNRRGYAPLLLCDQCGHSPLCKNCDLTLTHHKKRNVLLCHLCSYQIPFQQTCSECGIGHLADMGSGTERIEEELMEFLPNTKCARFDLDSTRRKHSFQRIMDDFENGDIDVLIGTQMVTKGLDFENVGLVGIMNADLLLKYPDFRSHEQAFQMLTQVAGRAGRKQKRGKVLIQVYEAEHHVIQQVLLGDYKGFLAAEMEERRAFIYPPYYRMIEVRMKHRDRHLLYQGAKSLGLVLKEVFGSALLGPEFPHVERVKNRYSMHFILRFDKGVNVTAKKKKLREILDNFISMDKFKNLYFQFDVDPY
ncbi:MAG: primosomal protein N' [Vicingaceae bacterium]